VAGKLGHDIRSRVLETMMPNGGSGGSSKGMGGYASGGSGGVAASEHDTSGKVAYGEPLGIELHRAVVVASQATNREKGMS
jgi:hypothetical protein